MREKNQVAVGCFGCVILGVVLIVLIVMAPTIDRFFSSAILYVEAPLLRNLRGAQISKEQVGAAGAACFEPLKDHVLGETVALNERLAAAFRPPILEQMLVAALSSQGFAILPDQPTRMRRKLDHRYWSQYAQMTIFEVHWQRSPDGFATDIHGCVARYEWD